MFDSNSKDISEEDTFGFESRLHRLSLAILVTKLVFRYSILETFFPFHLLRNFQLQSSSFDTSLVTVKRASRNYSSLTSCRSFSIISIVPTPSASALKEVTIRCLKTGFAAILTSSVEGVYLPSKIALVFAPSIIY